MRVAAEDLRQLADEFRRRIANPVYPAFETGFDNRLGDQPGRIGKVKQDRVFVGMFFDQPTVAQDRRDRAHCHGKTARAGGLLTQRVMLQRDSLVADAALIAANAQRGNHVMGTLQRGNRIAGGRKMNIRANGIKYIAGDFTK